MARLGCAARALSRLQPAPWRGLALLAAAALLAGCERLHHHETSVTAAQKVLTRQRQGLQSLVSAAEAGRLLPFDSVLVALDQSLVQDLLTASLPDVRVIEHRFQIRIDRGSASFEDGFALVRLDGTARLVDRPDDGYADVSLYGSLDVVQLDPKTEVLRVGMHVIALDARAVHVLGVKTSVVESLVEDLGREQLDAFAPLARPIEVPVQVRSSIPLPDVGTDGGVRIAAADIPLRAQVADIRSFRGKLWVSIDVKTGAAAQAAR
jgi:hypothetical protein